VYEPNVRQPLQWPQK